MTLMFDVAIDKNQYNVGFGSVPIRILNIRASSGTYGGARFYLSSSGTGKFSGGQGIYPDGNQVYASYSMITIGSVGTNNTLELIYTPESSGNLVITIKGIPYINNQRIDSDGSAVSTPVNISAMFCDYARAMFTTSVTDGYAPLTVNFNCTTPDQNISILWDFGDGATSTQRNPTHTYNTTGQFRPNLTVAGWKNASCAGPATPSSVSDRIIDVFKQGVPQCITGIRCNTGAGFYEECVNESYRLTTQSCGTTTKQQETAAQTLYTSVVVGTLAKDPTSQPVPILAPTAISQSVATTILTGMGGSVGVNVIPVGSPITSPSSMYTQSPASTVAGGGTIGTGGPLIGSTSLLFNPITLAAAGLGVAGIAIYFWKFRKPRGEL